MNCTRNLTHSHDNEYTNSSHFDHQTVLTDTSEHYKNHGNETLESPSCQLEL